MNIACTWWCDGANTATHMRHYSFPDQVVASKPACRRCLDSPAINKEHLYARIEPLLVVDPHSNDHLTLEAAFHVLACDGNWTAAELAAMPIAQWRELWAQSKEAA